MSNNKYAYGWSGHILARKSEQDDDRREKLSQLNVIPIPDEIFDRIAEDMSNLSLPEGIEAEQLGYLAIEKKYFLATGVGFTESFTYYGAPFEEAEIRAEKGELSVDLDAEYILAMKQHYGIDLPPCRLMVGCASEH